MKYLFTFVVGVMTGAVIALIFAPESGQDFRTHVGERATAEQHRAQAEYQRKREEMQTRLDKVQSTVQTKMGRTNQETVEDVAETVEATPEGYVVSE